MALEDWKKGELEVNIRSLGQKWIYPKMAMMINEATRVSANFRERLTLFKLEETLRRFDAALNRSLALTLTSSMYTTGKRITLTNDRDLRNEDIEHLTVLWEQLQLVSVEGAAHIEIDFLSFTESTIYFAAITPKIDETDTEAFIHASSQNNLFTGDTLDEAKSNVPNEVRNLCNSTELTRLICSLSPTPKSMARSIIGHGTMSRLQ